MSTEVFSFIICGLIIFLLIFEIIEIISIKNKNKKIESLNHLEIEKETKIISKIRINDVLFETFLNEDGLIIPYLIFQFDPNSDKYTYAVYQYKISNEILKSIFDRFMKEEDYIKINSNEELYELYNRLKNIKSIKQSNNNELF